MMTGVLREVLDSDDDIENRMIYPQIIAATIHKALVMNLVKKTKIQNVEVLYISALLYKLNKICKFYKILYVFLHGIFRQKVIDL